MSKTLMIKTMVLGAVVCAFSSTGFAATVQNGPGQGSIASATEVNEAKHEAVRSNWMDRTDIKVGSQAKTGMQVSVGTLQPLTHYDEHSKSVLFAQGDIDSRGGEAHEFRYYHGASGWWYPLNPLTGKGKGLMYQSSLKRLKDWEL